MSKKVSFTKAHIQRNLEQIQTLSYIRTDIRDYLKFYEERIFNHVIAQIKSQYESDGTHHNIPPAEFWELARLKTYDVCIPICTDWINQMKKDRQTLKETLNT